MGKIIKVKPYPRDTTRKSIKIKPLCLLDKFNKLY